MGRQKYDNQIVLVQDKFPYLWALIKFSLLSFSTSSGSLKHWLSVLWLFFKNIFPLHLPPLLCLCRSVQPQFKCLLIASSSLSFSSPRSCVSCAVDRCSRLGVVSLTCAAPRDWPADHARPTSSETYRWTGRSYAYDDNRQPVDKRL